MNRFVESLEKKQNPAFQKARNIPSFSKYLKQNYFP